MEVTDLSQAITYRIDGVEGPGQAPAEYARWSYIGTLDGVARFLDGQAKAVMLEVDRLLVIDQGHLSYKPE
jgi:hypothetical protein